jgi:hypothetical protein
MAGRILLNTSGAPFRVRPQQRKRFDDMYDTGQLTGAEYMDQAGKGIDLAMKVYGMANEAAKFTGGGQAVKPDAASLAADQGADAVVAAQQAQQAQAQAQSQMAAKIDPQQRYMAAVDAVNNAQTLEQLQAAQTEAQLAQQGLQLQPQVQQQLQPQVPIQPYQTTPKFGGPRPDFTLSGASEQGFGRFPEGHDYDDFRRRRDRAADEYARSGGLPELDKTMAQYESDRRINEFETVGFPNQHMSLQQQQLPVAGMGEGALSGLPEQQQQQQQQQQRQRIGAMLGRCSHRRRRLNSKRRCRRCSSRSSKTL